MLKKCWVGVPFFLKNCWKNVFFWYFSIIVLYCIINLKNIYIYLSLTKTVRVLLYYFQKVYRSHMINDVVTTRYFYYFCLGKKILNIPHKIPKLRERGRGIFLILQFIYYFLRFEYLYLIFASYFLMKLLREMKGILCFYAIFISVSNLQFLKCNWYLPEFSVLSIFGVTRDHSVEYGKKPHWTYTNAIRAEQKKREVSCPESPPCLWMSAFIKSIG